MDTKRTTANLDTVANEVVGLGADLLRMLVEQRNIVGVRHRERVVSSHKALFFVAPLKEREVDNPQAFEDILVAKAQTVAHLKTQRAELDTCLVGIVATKNKNEVAIFGSCRLLDLLQLVSRVELINRALHRPIAVIFNVY